MATIFDYFNAQAIAAFIANNPSNDIPYLGATLFPAKKKMGLDLAWLKGSQGIPVSLQPSAFDAKATLRDRIGFQKIETEMPFFREAMRIGEKDRQEILKLQGNANDQYIMPLITQIYDDIKNLVDGADVIPERMIMQLLSSGKIRITANRQDLDYNYGMKANHQETLTGTAAWSNPNSTPIPDIQRWKQIVKQATGKDVKRGILTEKTWGYLLKHPSIRLDMNPLGGQNIILTDSMLQQYLQIKLGITFAVYNKIYGLQDGTQHQFYPDDHVTLIPDGNLGSTWYGVTPEEADLMSGSVAADVQIVNNGVAVTTIKEPHPVNVETIVSEIVLPSFETIDSIFIAKVA